MKKIILSFLMSIVVLSAFAKMPTDFNRNETNKQKIQQWMNDASVKKLDKITLNIMLITADMDASKTSYADFKKPIIDFSNTETFAQLCSYKKGDKKFEESVKNLICSTIVNTRRFQPFFEFVLKDTYMEDCIYLKYQCFYQGSLTKYYTVNKAIFRKHFKLGVKGTSRVKHKQDAKRASGVLSVYKKQMTNEKLGLTKEEINEDLRFAKIIYFPNLKDDTNVWKPICVKLELMIKANQ